MEINLATYDYLTDCEADKNFYQEISVLYAEAGYEVPTLIFWNVDSKHDTFLVDSERKNTILCSGQSPTTFKYLISSIGSSPADMMLKVLNSERYEVINIDK